MNTKALKNISHFLNEKDGFIITSHVRSDGDSIGSELAVAHLLSTLGKKFYIYNNDPCAEYLKFLPHSHWIKTSPPNLEEYFHIIVLDGAFSNRIGEKVYSHLKRVPLKNIVAIDHHPNPTFNDKCYIKPTASSTGELVYDLVEYMNVEITPDIAVCLYTAMFTDTQGFRQTNTTSRSLYVASILFPLLPYSHYQIISHLYESKRFCGLKLLGDFLRYAKFDEEYGIIYSILTKDMFSRWGASEEDIEDFIATLRSVKGVRVAITLRNSSDGNIKVNLRAKDENIDLVPFVRAMGGGGHPKAAGFTIEDHDIDKALRITLESIKKYIGISPKG